MKGIIAKDKRKISLVYYSGDELGKRMLAYLSASRKKLLAVDIAKEKITPTQWVEIAEGLDIPIADLIDQKHDHYKKLAADNGSFDENDLLTLLIANPQLLRYPIAIHDNRFSQLKTAADAYSYLGTDSAGIPKDYPKSDLP